MRTREKAGDVAHGHLPLLRGLTDVLGLIGVTRVRRPVSGKGGRAVGGGRRAGREKSRERETRTGKGTEELYHK